MSQRSTILIMGAGGFIGSHVSRSALASGWRAIGTSRSAELTIERLEDEIDELDSGERVDVRCDLDDVERLERLIAVVCPDAIVNAAGSASVPASWSDPIGTARLHALGALNLLEATRRTVPEAHLLFFSSAEVYGSSRHPAGENDPLRPLTPYGAAKLAMEAFCDQQRRAHGRAIAVVRPFNQIGPGLPPGNPVADFVAAVARAEAAGEDRITIGLGNPRAVRDFTDVRDAAEAVMALVGRGLEGTFNICSGNPTTMPELVQQIDALSSVTVSSETDPGLTRPVDPGFKVGSPDVLAESVRWSTRLTLEESLRDMLEAARGGTP